MNSSNSQLILIVQILGVVLSADGSDNATTNHSSASAIQVNKGNVKLVDNQLTGHNIMTIMDGSLKASGLADIGLRYKHLLVA